jgi:hypothetical protein
MHHLKYILGILLLLGSHACSDDFLEQQKLDGLTEDTFFQTETHARAAIAGIYDILHGDGGVDELVTKGIYYHANYFSQDIRNQGADEFYARYEVPTNYNILYVLWSSLYQGIARANAAIPRIEAMGENKLIEAELANRLVGEAKFLRGLYYYYLTVNFGGVPVILSEQSAGDDLKVARSSEQATFQAIESDFAAAAEALPWTYPADAVGRATKGAALAYLGQTQMWLANENDSKWAEAKANLERIVNEGVYSLEQDFFALHQPNYKNGIESIFEIQHKEEANQTWGREDHNSLMQMLTMPTEAGGWGAHNSTKDLYDAFEEGDVRRRASVIGPGEEHPSPEINILDYSPADNINTFGTKENPWGLNGYGIVKYWRQPEVCGSCPKVAMDANIILMRYAEVLLNLAETYAKTGDDAQAFSIVNDQIRARADGYTETLPALSGDAMDAIMSERRKEFAAEFSWWWTLRRTGMGEEFVRENHPDVPIQNYNPLLPIPLQELETNPNLTQNPGY